MAVATRVASRALVMPAAMNAASHSRGPGGLAGVAIAWKIIRATTAARLNWARLNARLTLDWFRSRSSASPVPRTQAATYSVGGSRNRKATPGTSLNENECRSRRKWMSTTLVSPRKNATAASGHGMRNRSGNGGGGMSRTTARYRIAATAAMMTVKPRTRTAGVSHGGATKRRRVACAGSLDRGLGAVLACGCCHRDLGAVKGFGAAPVSGVWCADALAQRSYALPRTRHAKSGPGWAALRCRATDRERSSWAQSQR